jgi:hypothetical protein
MPVMAQDVVVVVHVNVVPDVGTAVTLYDVMGEPPLDAGATHDTVEVVPLTADATAVGACGARVIDHLRARYSSIVRRSVAVSERFNTMTSGTSPIQK